MTPVKHSSIVAPPPPRILVLILSLLLLPIAKVNAASITVSGNCSLEEAIQNANDDAQTNTDCTAGSGADTITLSANITQQTVLPLIDSDITIDGAGYTISYTGTGNQYYQAIIESAAGSNLTLQDITISHGGGGSSYKGAIELAGSATLTRVSVIASHRIAIQGTGASATYAFESVDIRNMNLSNYSPGIIWAKAGQYTVNNINFGEIENGGALFAIDSGAQVTLTGCLHRHYALPQLKAGEGTLQNNSSGRCSGTIGNGYSVPTEAINEISNACGVYENWPNISYSAQTTRSITLSSDCDLAFTAIFVPHNLHLTISSPVGQNYYIKSHTRQRIFVVAGKLTLRNVELIGNSDSASAGFPEFAISARYAKSVRLEDVTIRPDSADNPYGRVGVELNAVKEAIFNRVTIRDHEAPAAYSWYGSAIYLFQANRVEIRDSEIRDNSNGAAAIQAAYGTGSTVKFYGTTTFSGNQPKDIHDPNGYVTGCPGCPPNPAPVGPPNLAPGGDGGSGSGSSDSDDSDEVERFEPRVSTGEELMANSDIRVWAQYGVGSGIQFQRRDVGEIGIQSVIDMGVLDVWGYAEQDWEVCFPQRSSLLFIDSARIPKAPQPAFTYSKAGMTCTANNRAGTLVLLPGPPAPAQGPAPLFGQRLDNCMVITRDMLRFRNAPGGTPLQYTDPWGRQENGWLPSTVTLTALERTPDWFKVDYHGTQGWVSAHHVTPHGTCG